ncbi:MAG: collagen-binding domain-containing protein, partial [Eubacterium sp.]
TNNSDVTAKGGGVYHTLLPLGEQTVSELKGQDGTKSISSLDQVYVYLLKQKQGSSYGKDTEYDQNNFAYIESGSKVESDLTASYDHQLSLTDDSSANTAIRIASSHQNTVNDSEIRSKLGKVLQYGIFTKNLTSLGADTECTVAADNVTATSIGSNLGLSASNWSGLNINTKAGKNTLTVTINGNLITKVRLEPSTSGQNAATASSASRFLKRALDLGNNGSTGTDVNSSDSNESEKEVTNGTAVFEDVKAGSYKIIGYDDNNEIIDVKYKTITNTSSGDDNKAEINTCYFGHHISDSLLNDMLDTKLRAPATLIANGNTYIKTADKQHTMRAGIDADKQIDFDASFANLISLSSELADAKSSDGVKVYYETPQSLSENNRSFDDSGNDWTVVNVDLTDAGNSYTLPGQYNDSTGQQMNGAAYTNSHSRIIWNFYTKGSNGSYSPYSGSITMGGTLCGILLAPSASVSGAKGDLGGCVAAASYGHSTGEVHQRSYTPSDQPIDQNITETLSNKAISVKKVWEGDSNYTKYRPGSITIN